MDIIDSLIENKKQLYMVGAIYILVVIIMLIVIWKPSNKIENEIIKYSEYNQETKNREMANYYFNLILNNFDNVIDNNISYIIKKSKNTIISSISNKIEETLTNQIKAVEKIEKNCNNWKEAYGNKDFLEMEKAYKNIQNSISKIIPLENIINDARTIENLHELIKNNDIMAKHLHIPLQSGSNTILKSMIFK